MFIDTKTLTLLLPIAIKARRPILIRAIHGCGKSEITKSLASKIAHILYPDKK